ncbi:syntaxin-binding protein 5-like [Limulus polyphemus]|uniref:Syntaxin-binding protein 5-like n=1 Tax=Limulus polyphemus TaxID=6850 RepID=A0ABM1SZI5_LIMPO|nr:syntaxin-binding protein 5-like [Limulus polyphemus]
MQRTEMKRTGGFFKDMFEGLKSSVGLSQSVKYESEIEETLQKEHFQALKTVRHGFPFQPTAVAYDPIQRILAIGTRTGSVKILGKPGVDCHVHHFIDSAVIQILFLINEGGLISVCSDDTLHLWNLRQKRPEILHSLKFQRERITYCHLPFQSKWLYIGTERGNVYTVNIESFILSGYVIHWNKAIKISQKTHPGCVVHLSENPVDANKLLIAFETGTVVLWDLRNRTVDMRLENTEQVKSVSWHHDGKQLMCSHADGSLSTWNIKMPMKPTTVMHPHSGNKGKPEFCKPIYKVEWKTVRRRPQVWVMQWWIYLLLYAGRLNVTWDNLCPHTQAPPKLADPVQATEDFNSLFPPPDFAIPSLSQPNESTRLNAVFMDFVSQIFSDFQEPYAVVVVLNDELVVVDLTTEGFPSFLNPYPMDLHESPVTFCTYLTDCPIDLIPALFSVGSKKKKHSGFSKKEWPISGGEWGTGADNYTELIITGHADGSLKFWDASSVSLQFLYKLKSSKVFEQPKAENTDYQEDEPFAIEQICLCSESRILCVAGASPTDKSNLEKERVYVRTMYERNPKMLYLKLFDLKSTKADGAVQALYEAFQRSGTIYRLKESILLVDFLDSNGVLIPHPSGFWKDVDYNNKENCDQMLTHTIEHDFFLQATMDNFSKNTDFLTPLPSEVCDNQFVIMVSEKQAWVVSLPSQSCMSRNNLTDTSFVVCAKVMTLKSVGKVCLACFIGNGNIVVYSLPNLRLFYEVCYLSMMDLRILKTFSFGTNGLGLYLCSASEIQKFTISSSFWEILQDMLSTVFVPKDMPEPPRKGFFRGLFGGGPSSLDREGLFGEKSGNASRSVAHHIPGNSSLEHVKAQTGSLAGELARARLGLTERGEALNQLEDKTAKMMSEAEYFSNTAHKLMLKYRDKKWYQF